MSSIKVFIVSKYGDENQFLNIKKNLFNDDSDITNFIHKGKYVKTVLEILTKAKTECPKKQVLIIKDDSVCDSVDLLMKTILKTKEQMSDLIYLCKWDESQEDLQSVLFSRKGRDKVIDILKDLPKDLSKDSNINKILLDNIKNKKLDASCCNPNIINIMPAKSFHQDDSSSKEDSENNDSPKENLEKDIEKKEDEKKEDEKKEDEKKEDEKKEDEKDSSEEFPTDIPTHKNVFSEKKPEQRKFLNEVKTQEEKNEDEKLFIMNRIKSVFCFEGLSDSIITIIVGIVLFLVFVAVFRK